MSHAGRAFMEPAKPARPWGSCITPTASPAAPAVSQTHFSQTPAFPAGQAAFGMGELE